MLRFLRRLAAKIKGFFLSFKNSSNNKPNAQNKEGTLSSAGSYATVVDKIPARSQVTPASDATFLKGEPEKHWKELDERRTKLRDEIFDLLRKHNSGTTHTVSHTVKSLFSYWRELSERDLLPTYHSGMYQCFFNNKEIKNQELKLKLTEYKMILDNDEYRQYLDNRFNDLRPAEEKFSESFVVRDKERKELEGEIYSYLQRQFRDSKLPSIWSKRTEGWQCPWEHKRFLDDNREKFATCTELLQKINRYLEIVEDEDYKNQYDVHLRASASALRVNSLNTQEAHHNDVRRLQ